jgi:DnaJ-domain-containing protein 1
MKMPRIILKHKSPEYADKKQKVRDSSCEMPGCSADADHKAPKHRGLNEYYHFCFEHAKDYNKAWDFFSGMSETEVQTHMTSAYYGDRPTWRYAGDGAAEDILRDAARNCYGENEGEKTKERNNSQRQAHIPSGTPEFEAMALMGLEPPMELSDIKERYKALAKKHHPDLNRGCQKSEELLKRINMAYTILKLAYEDYKNLPENK